MRLPPALDYLSVLASSFCFVHKAKASYVALCEQASGTTIACSVSLGILDSAALLNKEYFRRTELLLDRM